MTDTAHIAAVTADEIAATLRPVRPRGGKGRAQLMAGLEDYLFIGGAAGPGQSWRARGPVGLTAAAAAARLGVSARTINRYRAAIRAASEGIST